MKLNILILITVLINLVSCASDVRKDSEQSFNRQSWIKKEPGYDAGFQQGTLVVDYNHFIKVLDVAATDSMRREGLRKIATLKKSRKNKNIVPLSLIELLFDSLINDYPLNKHDKLIYRLAGEYEKQGQMTATLKSLSSLVSLYPEIRNYDEVQFRRGKILYAKHQYADAERAFKLAAEFIKSDSKSIYYEQSIYKQGWSQLMQGKNYVALNSFMHLLDIHAIDGEIIFKNMEPFEKKFVEEVLQSINLGFYNQSGPISVSDYFSTKQKPVYEHHIYKSLANFYLQRKNYSDAVKTYRLFVSKNRKHKKSPDFLIEIINIYDQNGFTDLLLSAKKDLVQRYNLKSTYWNLYTKNETTRQKLAVKKVLYQLAGEYHVLAKKSRKWINYREAQFWYRNWLNSFSDDAKAGEMSFKLAELLKDEKQFEVAAMQFEKTAYDYKKHPQSAEAGYAAMLMYESREKQLKGFAKKQLHRRLIESSIHFVNQFPEHPQVIKVKSQLIEKLYALGEYKKAQQLAGHQSVIKYPGVGKNVLSVNNNVANMELSKAMELIALRNLNEAINVLENFSQLNYQHEFQSEVTKTLAMLYLVNNNIKLASLEFEKVSYLQGKTEEKVNAMWLAAELSEEANDSSRAIKIYTDFIKRFPFPLERSIEAHQRVVDLYARHEDTLLSTQWRVKLVNADAKGASQRTKRTRFLAAHASFILAEPLCDSYRRAMLDLPIKKKLKVKQKLMYRALGAYDRAASYKIPEVLTASTYRKAEIYLDFKHARKVAGVNNEEAVKEPGLLSGLAYPLKEKAIELHEMNITYFTKGFTGVWVWMSLERLKILLPSRYNKKEQNGDLATELL